MSIVVTAFTKRGTELAHQLVCALGEGEVWTLKKYQKNSGKIYQNLSAWTEEQFHNKNSLVFISATAIAVRSIAPYVKDKLTDPAVVSVDEQGRFVVPLLSGHVGGANELARRIARTLGATPVISTATDLNQCFAVDCWAKAQGMDIENRKAAKNLSSALLAGETVGFYADCLHDALPKGVIQDTQKRHKYGFAVTVQKQCQVPQEWLILHPKVLTIGVGCKKNLAVGQVEQTVLAVLHQQNLSVKSVCAVASIDLKREDEGIQHFAEGLGVPSYFYTSEQLRAAEGRFSSSDFVYAVTGVDNVCERSAVLASNGGVLLVKKQVCGGVTVAVACKQTVLIFDSNC